MHLTGAPLAGMAGPWMILGLLAACVLLAATFVACGGGDSGPVNETRLLDLEAKTHAQEESLEALSEENAALRAQIDTLQSEQADFQRSQEAKEAAGEHEEEVADFEANFEEQAEQLSALEDGQARSDERLDALEPRLQELETIASRVDQLLPAIETWFQGMDKRVKQLEGTDLERTVSLAEAAGGEVYYIDHPDRDERAVLVMPLEPIEGNPLIVSLHGFGGNSADHARFVPLHERVVQEGFGLLLPNGIRNADGQRFWNPTELNSSSSKASQDDFAYLSHLVAEAQMLKNFGPVYIFGYSNGGFMAYYMACKGLPGLRAVASLAGTSYVDDAACEGAAPVSVLHIHGGADAVVLFDGKAAEPKLASNGGSPYYASAHEMLKRWGQRAGCEWPSNPEQFAHYATLDLDQFVQGPETLAFRTGWGCPDGINIELWSGVSSGHSPGYGDAFVDALLDWLLAQK